uniref:Uncharacterized protein n=1 Tax=Scleropages formosus TaxID=113540 RepID=A0A8C9V803_SCLFO
MLIVLVITRFVLKRFFELFRIRLHTNCALPESLASVPRKSEPVEMEGAARSGERGGNEFSTAACGDLSAAPGGELDNADEPDFCSFSEPSSQLSESLTSEVPLGRRSRNLRKMKDGSKLWRRKHHGISKGDLEIAAVDWKLWSSWLGMLPLRCSSGTEEMTAGHQGKVEDDMQQQTLLEDCVRREAYQRLDEIIAAFHRRYEREVADLESAMKRLKKDKDKLQNSLIRAQIKISYLQVEMGALKKEKLYQRLQHEREKNDLKKMLTECHSYYSHMKCLQQNMSESSDRSYSMLDRNAERSCKRIKERNVKTIPHNTLNSSSGLLLCSDAMDSSSSECDYEDHKDILGCVSQHSFGGGTQHLDNGISDWKSEHTNSAPGRYGSVSLASTRKLLSAFSCQVGKEGLSNTLWGEIRIVCTVFDCGQFYQMIYHMSW